METITLPHLPNSPIQVCLFNNVKNSAFLRQQLLQGNSDFEYAFLDASVLISTSHVLAACFKAISDSLNNRLKTRNVHSEIVFALSPNNNVSFLLASYSDDMTKLYPIDRRVFPPLRYPRREHLRRRRQSLDQPGAVDRGAFASKCRGQPCCLDRRRTCCRQRRCENPQALPSRTAQEGRICRPRKGSGSFHHRQHGAQRNVSSCKLMTSGGCPTPSTTPQSVKKRTTPRTYSASKVPRWRCPNAVSRSLDASVDRAPIKSPSPNSTQDPPEEPTSYPPSSLPAVSQL
jgi:hypothetical protein